MFDLAEFLKLSIPAGLFLVPVIMGLVSGLGDTFPAIKGRWQFLAAQGLGLTLGTGLFWAVTEPKSPGQWVACGLFGLITGLTASGKYNSDKASAQKGIEQAVEFVAEAEEPREPDLL